MTDHNKTSPDLYGVYKLSSVARPIDPAYLTNRALMHLTPIVGLLGILLSAQFGLGDDPLSVGLTSMASAFLAWALARELAPDLVGAAFGAFALAWGFSLGFGTGEVLFMFVCILIARTVNRTTGLPLRWHDTVSVLGLSAYAATSTNQPLILLVAALAFGLDGVLKQPLRRHLAVVLLLLAGFAWMLLEGASLISPLLAGSDMVVVGASAVGVLLVATLSGAPLSYTDTTSDHLVAARVNAGLGVVWLLAIQDVLAHGSSAWLATPVWACFIAVFVGFLYRKLRSG